MTPQQQAALRAETRCGLRFDNLTRQLYATDASIYQIEPWGVALPNTAEEAAELIRAAASLDIPIIPRGAGTGLAGAALGEGLVVDFSRLLKHHGDLDRDRLTIRVEPGVVLDQLNAYLKPTGYAFGPDVATSSRATLGGMIANNSSGARAPIYGTTLDHVVSLDVAFTDGRIETIHADEPEPSALSKQIAAILDPIAAEIDRRFPDGMVKRWPGYGVERWLHRGRGLTHILGGSEGTLAAIVSAELRVVPLPASKSIGVLFFDSVTEAMAATVDILDLKPAAVEHIDRVLFDQTRGQLAFARARALLELDAQPCEAILIVEFYDDDGARLETLLQRKLGTRRRPFTDADDMEHIWSLRKAGLSLLTGCKGAAKPTAGIEDVAVSPVLLPAYVEALQTAMARLGLSGSFYGHAASGLLHVRPVVDLHRAEDIKNFRAIADEVSAITKQFKGAIAAEHGIGIARTEYLAEHLGPELLAAEKKIKTLFDPKGVMNPGKLFDGERFKIDTQLRQGADSDIALPFEQALAFRAKDKSFIGNLEQCNGSGACRKLTPSMCPTYVATGEEIMSTRGRANVIRATLEGRLPGRDTLDSPELDEALSNCISCKACKTECPSNVDMAQLKADLLYARYRKRGVPLRTRLLSRVDRIGRMGAIAPGLANALSNGALGRIMRDAFFGLEKQRPLPAFAAETFDAWYQRRNAVERTATRGAVRLWVDCFARYYEPNIAQAAIAVLEAAGYEVRIADERACCGRPAFSLGRLDVARDQAAQSVAALSGDDLPVVALEPSCYSMLSEDFRELRVEGADALSKRTVLFENFVDGCFRNAEIAEGSLRKDIVVHSHCHAKAITHANDTARRVASRLTTGEVRVLNTGCCGMAGAFGALKEKYELSRNIGRPLIEMVDDAPEDALIVASGTSCRHQIEHLAQHGRKAIHMAEAIAMTFNGDA